MPKEWTRSITDQASVELEVKLDGIFPNVDIPESSGLREAIGQEVIDIIRERTQGDQKSWTGSRFRKYSEEYADSLEFKAEGKSVDSPNLTQSGDMLGLLTIKGVDETSIRIGWTDTLQSEKAHGHITGAVGVKRDFLGLNSGEIDRIRSKFGSELPNIENRDVLSSILSSFELAPSPIRRSVAQTIDLFFGDEE